MDQPAATPPTNVPEYSVSDIAGAVKRTLEQQFGRVRVRGEITELKRYPSGHVYFSLKDEGAKISGVVWKFAVPRLGLVPENGMEVIATGKLSSYPERSNYQLIVDRMEFAGAGALLARIEALRLRLAEEGLFGADRKRALPVLPGVIGVITSAQGAVIQDIRTTIARRWPRRIILWPVPVQGDGAAERIVAAIEGFGRLLPGGEIPRPDVLIVARGGGSLEDLMAFNDEAVVRAAAASPIPLISAVGHETDTTLIDHASDRRAPTPTAAAELAVPSRIEVLADVENKAARLVGAYARADQFRRLRLDRATHAMPDLPGLVGTARQRLDDRAARLALALPNLLAGRRAAIGRTETLPRALMALLAARRAALVQAERHVPPPSSLIASRRAMLALADSRLRAALRHAVQNRRTRAAAILPRLSEAPMQARLREATAKLAGLTSGLEALGPMQVLQRGYAVIRGADGHVVTEAAGLRPASRVTIRFHDGEVGATTDPKGGPSRQGSLGL